MAEKTEKQIIDSLGQWLCEDMELTLADQEEIDGYRRGRRGGISTYHAAAVQNIIYIADRIKFYRDNCIKEKVMVEITKVTEYTAKLSESELDLITTFLLRTAKTNVHLTGLEAKALKLGQQLLEMKDAKKKLQ